ncbi:MAG: CAP domain-containing protein [Bacillota bacterium]|nr:CAP domain-containing protein [Bacillota bacterium]
MFRRKHSFIIFTVVFLFLVSMVPTAAACQYGNWTTQFNGVRVPLNFVSGTADQSVYRVEVPLKDGQADRKIVIYYRINLRTGNVTLIPAPTPPAPVPPEPTPPAPGQSILSADELQMFNLVNEERKQRGLNELIIHENLVKVARLKSKDMIDRGYFAHQSPTYGSPFDMIKNAGIAFTYAGENLAGASTVARAHTSLMNSPGHRANILNVNYTHVGIGIVNGGPYGKMFTQMFIRPR